MPNLYEAIPTDLPDEVFEQLAAGGSVRVERILSKGHRSPASGWYDQGQDEWVAVLRGEAVLDFEDRPSVTLKAGDYLTIPAHQRHRVAWTTPEVETIWLAVHF